MNTSYYLLLRYLFLLLVTFVFLSELFLQTMIALYTYISFAFSNFFEVAIIQNGSIFIENKNILISIVEECIAPTAYILISFIFLTMPLNKKILFSVWIKSIVAFSVFNLIRIFIMILVIIYSGISTFQEVHSIFYNFLSGIGVSLIVLYFLRKDELKYKFPIYSDVKWIIKEFFSNPKKTKK